MGGSAVGEEPRFVGISVEPERGDTADPGGGEASDAIGFEVEMRLASGAVGEKAVVGGVVGQEAGAEALVDLIAGARDARADRGGDAIDPRAEAEHRGDGAVGDPGEGAAPAGVGGTDHARFAVGEQDRGAIGGNDRQQEAGAGGDQRVGLGSLVVGPGIGDDDAVGRVDLIGRHQWRAGEKEVGGAAAVGERGRVGLGERAVARLGAEEAVGDGDGRGGERAHNATRMTRSSST